MTTKSEAHFGCLALIIVTPLGVVLQGFVLSRLWTWFMVPLGVVEIGIAHAVGLSLTVAMFTTHLKGDSDESGDGMTGAVGRMVGVSIIAPLLFLAFGWAVYCWSVT